MQAAQLPTTRSSPFELSICSVIKVPKVLSPIACAGAAAALEQDLAAAFSAGFADGLAAAEAEASAAPHAAPRMYGHRCSPSAGVIDHKDGKRLRRDGTASPPQPTRPRLASCQATVPEPAMVRPACRSTTPPAESDITASSTWLARLSDRDLLQLAARVASGELLDMRNFAGSGDTATQLRQQPQPVSAAHPVITAAPPVPMRAHLASWGGACDLNTPGGTTLMENGKTPLLSSMDTLTDMDWLV